MGIYISTFLTETGEVVKPLEICSLSLYTTPEVNWASIPEEKDRVEDLLSHSCGHLVHQTEKNCRVIKIYSLIESDEDVTLREFQRSDSVVSLQYTFQVGDSVPFSRRSTLLEQSLQKLFVTFPSKVILHAFTGLEATKAIVCGRQYRHKLKIPLVENGQFTVYHLYVSISLAVKLMKDQ